MFTHLPRCSQGLAPAETGTARVGTARGGAGRPLLPTQTMTPSPMEHSSTSWSHAPPVKPGGQVQMARPFTGFVSQIASSWQGLLTQASSR